MRLFVAAMLSEEMKREITDLMHELKMLGIKGNYVPARNLHLTLAFIGECKEKMKVIDALSGIDVKPFRLAFSEMGVFNQVLWVGLKGNQGLSQAAKDVRGALDAAGISYDRKKFEPHISIIRNVGGDWKKASLGKAEMMAKKISLMKSEEKEGKRVYTELFSI